jgi:hypothetical protein
MTIATGLLGIAMVGIWQLFGKTSDAAKFGLWSTDLDRTVRLLFDRFLTEVKESGTDELGGDHVVSHPRSQNNSKTKIDFQMRQDFDGGADDWSSTVTYELAPSQGETPGNGIDDDDDGLVDEQQFVRKQDAETVALAEGVLSFQVTRVANEDKLNLTVRVARPVLGGGQPMERLLTAVVALRNRG